MLIDIISCLASLLPFINIQICGLSLKLFLFNFFFSYDYCIHFV